MRKKILIAEKSDAIRGIAESLLHQNGFDVISASDSTKAKEFIFASEPNMIIVGADLKDDDGKYLYEQLETNPQTLKLPLLLIESPDNPSLPYPPEVILSRPFDANEFIDRVKLFVGAGDTKEEENVKTVEPLVENSVDDEFLDSALGIDHIEVEESEVMNQTNISQKIQQVMKDKKKDIYDIHQDTIHGITKNELDDTGGKVESLLIRDDSEIESNKEKNKKDVASNLTSGIDISSDQYGLMKSDDNDEIEPEAIQPPKEEPKKDHDYEWFIGEMKKDGSGGKPEEKTKTAENDSGNIHTTSASDFIEPVTNKSVQSDFQPGTGIADEPEINTGGVDEFISEFKKEVQQLNSESDKDEKPNAKGTQSSPTAVMQETVSEPKPELDPAEIHHYVSHLIEMMAEKVAKNIVDKIDKDELYRMLKDNLSQAISNKK